MMTRRGHVVFHYGHDRSIVECTENVGVTNDAILEKTYGQHDWRAEGFKHDTSDAAHICFNIKAAEEVALRKQAGDYLLLFWGHGHAHVAKCHPDLIVVEPGIGSFNNVLAPYSVFESYAVMHHVYARFNLMPRQYDAVVPNYFDPDDFIDASTETSKEKGLSKFLPDAKPFLNVNYEYALFIGRVISSKGIQIAIAACRLAGIKLLIAGQGHISKAVDTNFVYELSDITDSYGVTHIGYIEPHERAVLIAKAKCIMCPTLYAEPFGGVNVESQMSGVPVITSDYGGFAETVLHGLSGYRCRTMEQYVWALKNVQYLDRAKIRAWALDNYSFAKVGSMYEEYFTMLRFHKFGGTPPDRLALKWLEKKY